MTIRPYEKSNADQLTRVFCKHVPTAFGENEVDPYVTFLQTYTDPYFVAEHNGQVLGACGYYVKHDEKEAHICWILADPDTSGQGIGKALLQHTLHLIDHEPDVQRIVCRTSQVAYTFFEPFGFRLQYTEPNFWAPGLDLYFMVLTGKTL